MNECEYRSWLTPYHDEELEPERRDELERHLAECEDCAAELEKLRNLSRLLARPRPAAPPGGMMQRLHAAVGSTAGGGVVRLCRRVGLAAAALLVLSVGLTWHAAWQPAPSGPPADWEVAAVTLDSEIARADSRGTLAVWMVSDLSQEATR